MGGGEKERVRQEVEMEGGKIGRKEAQGRRDIHVHVKKGEKRGDRTVKMTSSSHDSPHECCEEIQRVAWRV